MITEKTVLVLGAGASIPFDFPSGKELVKQICNMLRDDNKNIYLSFFTLGFQIEKVKNFRKALSLSGQRSVDAFLEYRTEFIDVGKAAIAMVLLPFEKTTSLFDLEMDKNWYEHLFGELNTSFEEFGKNNLSIITFNYDRSIEHYLFTALQKTHGKSDKDCAEKLSSIPIIHVHGKLGDFEWEPNHPLPVPYDLKEPLESDRIKRASKKIKIIHENIAEDSEFKQAHQLLSEAARVYFLGFGYHPTNLNRLIGNLQCRNVQIDGTMYEMPLGTKREARKILTKFRPNTAWRWEEIFPDEKIYEFLYNNITL